MLKESIINIWLKKTQSTKIQFFRSFISWWISGLCDVTIIYILTESLLLHYMVSVIFGFLVWSITNYWLNIFWIFQVKNIPYKKSYLMFASIGIIGLCITEFLMYMFVEFAWIWYIYSKVIAALIVLLWNFTARKIFIFKD